MRVFRTCPSHAELQFQIHVIVDAQWNDPDRSLLEKTRKRLNTIPSEMGVKSADITHSCCF